MTCYNHPGMGAVAVCGNCGKECCSVCITRVGDRVVCRDCADVVRSQQPPEPEATMPEEPEPEEKAPETTVPEQPQPEVKAPAEEQTSLPAVSRPSGVSVPVKQAGIVPATPPSPPAVHDPGAGGPREKESLLSAGLSLILPGAGQVYNGQIAKGVILAVLYLGSMAVILVLIVLAAMYARRACWFCLPTFILPLIVLVYAIYDAYGTAEKINNGQPAKDWL
jgi:TM2 domain-containing membrane protein YozV